MVETTMTLKSPRKPWTHEVERKRKPEGDWPSNKEWDLFAFRPSEPENAEQVFNIYTSLEEEMVKNDRCIISWDGENWTHRLLNRQWGAQNGMSMDQVSFALAYNNREVMQTLYTMWITMEKDFGSENVSGFTISHEYGRFRVEGEVSSVEFGHGRLTIGALLPQTVEDRAKGMALKDLIGIEGLPEGIKVKATDQKREGKTIITYEAGDVPLERVFGSDRDHAFLPEGEEVTIKLERPDR